MKLLSCNVGSTSYKYKLFDMSDNEKVLASGGAERVGAPMGNFQHKNHLTGEVVKEQKPFPQQRDAIECMIGHLLNGVIKEITEIECVSFKVVHAKGIAGAFIIDDEIMKCMDDFSCITPTHNPPYLAAIRQFQELLPDATLVTALETGFHKDMPMETKLYSLPIEISEKYDIYHYGFHGASHEYISDFVNEKVGRKDLKVISCHLGGSSSLCAIDSGRSIDTTAGFGNNSGILSNNRIGDIDPYIVFYLHEEYGMPLDEIKEMFQNKSGLLGLSRGCSNDLRDLQEAADAGNEDAKLAINCYIYQMKKYLGSYMAALGGIDVIVFTAGIGKNSPTVRAGMLEGLEFCGVELDKELNKTAKVGDDISVKGSKVRIFIIDTDEEVMIARKAMQAIAEAKK